MQISLKPIRRCSVLLIIGEMQIKTTIISYLSEWQRSKSLTTYFVGGAAGKQALYIAGRNAKQFNLHGGEFIYLTKLGSSFIQQSSF